MEATVPLKVQEAIFDQLLNHPENKVCADCPNKSPTWTSIDFGVFICLRCAGVHRQLGPSVTRVRSAKLDSWKMENIEILAAVGNKIANDYWENNLPSYYKKPDITTSMEDVRRMVNDKYIKRMFAPKDDQNPVEEFVEAKKNTQITAGAFRQQKLGQSGDNSVQAQKPIKDTPIVKVAETKVASKNLLDFEDDDNAFENFKSAPEKNVKLDIPKPDFEIKFSSNNGMAQKTSHNTGSINLLNMNFEASMPNNNTSLNKASSAEPFQFINTNKNQQQQQQQKALNSPSVHNRSQSQTVGTNIYSMYNTGGAGNTITSTTQPNTKNYSGGQSNYAYLDMLGGQSQQNRFYQQPQQGFSFQNTTSGQGFTNQFNGSTQNNFGGFGTQNTATKPSSGFDFGGSNKGYGTGFGGGMSNGGYSTSNNGFNSTGFSGTTGSNSGMQGGFDFKSTNVYGGTQQQQPQQQQQGFTSNPSTTTTFSLNTGSNVNTFSQPSNTNAGFSFF